MERKTKAKTGFALHPRWRVTNGKNIALGPGKVDLLALLAETGSISKAAEEMGMSYMRAWSLIKTMNESFQSPLVLTERGGRQRGGAVLTQTGRAVLTLYRQIEKESLRAVQIKWRALHVLLRA